MNRRKFFKTVSGLTASAVIAPFVLSTFSASAFAEESRRKKPGTGPEMVDNKDQTAKALQYVDLAKTNPKSLGNTCASCQLYSKKEMKNGKEVGSCSLFPNKYVYAEGYCNSWAKKAV